jgi:hypothetical protein
MQLGANEILDALRPGESEPERPALRADFQSEGEERAAQPPQARRARRLSRYMPSP